MEALSDLSYFSSEPFFFLLFFPVLFSEGVPSLMFRDASLDAIPIPKQLIDVIA